MVKALAVISKESIEERIYFIRGHKVMLSPDLAVLYGVEPRALVQAVKRNAERFPDDFMFQLNEEEYRSLRSQIVILEKARGSHQKYRPYAFTEQGVVMLSAVLRSERAVQVSIAIARVFVKLRQLSINYEDFARRINELEAKCDQQFRIVFEAIRELMEPHPVPATRRIGFAVDKEERKRKI